MVDEYERLKLSSLGSVSSSVSQSTADRDEIAKLTEALKNTKLDFERHISESNKSAAAKFTEEKAALEAKYLKEVSVLKEENEKLKVDVASIRDKLIAAEEQVGFC